MCGIVAVYYKQNLPIDVKPMLDAISHRGKDQVSIKEHINCTVGFRRLAITNIETTQPQGVNWIIYLNGEIYNYAELGLVGTETQVLSQGFEKFGIDFVKRLNGMFFILAIHGSDVYIIRDRYGIKPVYYWENEKYIVVASEIKAIIKHPEYRVSQNESAYKQWQVFNNVLTNETLFAGIYKFEKGSIKNLNTGIENKYWEWKFKPKQMNYSEAISELRYLIVRAIRRQTPKEVAYGSCLSSGIDSNIIVALSDDMYTFTAGFSQDDDESIIARIQGKKHYEIIYNQVRDLTSTIYHLEDLRVGASWSNYGLYELASKYVKVLFDGAGADELFSGYKWRYEEGNYYNIVNRTNKSDLFCEDIFKKIFTEDTLENRFLFDANYFLEGVLLVVDKISMAHTIEVRLPFLDNDLVDFCIQLPNEFKKNKHILKEAFSNLLPQQILEAPKKGFSSPDWFNGQGNKAMKWADAAYNEWYKLYIQ